MAPRFLTILTGPQPAENRASGSKLTLQSIGVHCLSSYHVSYLT
jgi:hypothetical protein